IFTANFNRLTRDYTGMLRYSTLLQQGMIKAPVITQQQQTVTGDKNRLMLGDKTKFPVTIPAIKAGIPVPRLMPRSFIPKLNIRLATNSSFKNLSISCRDYQHPSCMTLL
ncbi:type IV secretory system conjugative DNA transfer family protein, partial [Micromonospora harpali]